ncbi:MAG: NAD-dependent epimerase/dehydratase family protein [Patescibacteria group bacterium]|jgi:UDP-glucose 4-epimerase
MNYNKYQRVLVTGAAGFMGSHLVDYLIAKGCNVFGLDDLSGGYMRNVNPKSQFTVLDLRDKQATADYINKIKPDLIYHLAADATEGRSQFTPQECTERNYFSYLNLLIPAIKNGLKKMLLTSSMSVYGNQEPPFTESMPTRPEDIYAISKASMEQATKILAEVHNFEFTVIRPHNVYGPRQNKADPYRNVVGIFINKLLENKPYYIYGDGNQKRAFTYIDDCVPPMAEAGFMDNLHQEIINIGPEEEITINELSNIILEEFFPQAEDRAKFDPIHLPDRPQEVKNAFSSNQKAKQLLNYEPKTPLRDGLRQMLVWAREVGYEQPKYLDNLELETVDTPRTWKERLI